MRFWDRVEDRADRAEDRIDRRHTYGKSDLAEDRVDSWENRFDRRNGTAKCAANEDVNCRAEAQGRIETWWENRSNQLTAAAE